MRYCCLARFVAFVFVILFLSIIVFAESNPQPSPSPTTLVSESNPQPSPGPNQYSQGYGSPNYGQQGYSQPQMNYNQSQPGSQYNNGGGGGFDFGMPDWSSADPEYVAKQKMVEGMTNAYTWVSMNSARFSEGCKSDKTSLVSEISNIIQQAQEASSACKRFELEAGSCDPEFFCSGFSKGKLPIPPEAKSTLKKLGYNPDSIKIEDITPDLISKVCLEQASSEFGKRKQMIGAAKNQVLTQLANLRKNCESMQNNNVPDIRLPDFKPFQNGPNISNRQVQNTQAVCPGSAPNCGGSSRVYCENGNWVCASSTNTGNYSNGQPMGPYCPAPAPLCNGGDSPSCIPGGWSCPQGMASQQQGNSPQYQQQQGCDDPRIVCGMGMQPVCNNGRKECVPSNSQNRQQNSCPGNPYDCGNGVMAFCQDGRWSCPPSQQQNPPAPQNTQQNDTQQSNTQQNDIQQNNTQQSNTQQNNTVQNTSSSSTPVPGPGAAYPPTASTAPASGQVSGVQVMVNHARSLITGLFTESADSTSVSQVSESNPQTMPNTAVVNPQGQKYGPQGYNPQMNNPQGPNNQPGPKYGPQKDYGPKNNYGPQGNYGPQNNYGPRNDYGPKNNYGPRNDYGPQNNYGPQGYNPQMNNQYNKQGPNNQQNNYGPAIGPSPESLCKMSDEEVLEIYVGNMEDSVSNDEQMNQYRCKQEAIKIIDEMSRYKLEIARCKADAALDCQAKTQALSTCNQLKNEPEKIASMVVDNMCRRFVAPEEAKNNKLLGVAEKFNEMDPALANQLGDTAEQNISDKKKLDIVSYLLGNGDYGAKLKERATKLKEIRDRLQSKNAGDADTIAVLDQQIKDLADEGGKFSNALDIARIGYLFKQ